MEKTAQDVPALTVTQLTKAIKQSLESTFPSIWLQGEVSNFKKHSSGHLYFSLKDSGAQIAAVMFRGCAQSLKVLPKDGDQVTVYGSLNVFPPSGKYQISVQSLKLAGVGELLLKLEELKKELHKRGWFSSEHKKPLPKFPKRIGVVTSPTGAAIQDILNVLTRRFSGFQLLLYPVRVQGNTASKEISQAIEQLNKHQLVDVMIVGRGGGSIEDLWAFNEEIVAKAIFESKIPVVGAVGHETDHSIAEYVADIRAPTPSAAAEIVCAEKAQQLKFLEKTEAQLTQILKQQIRHHRQRYDSLLRNPVIRSPYTLLGPWMQRLDDLRQLLDQGAIQKIEHTKVLIQSRQKLLNSLKPTAQISFYRQRIFNLNKQLDHRIRYLVQQKKERLKHVIANLNSIDPKNLLKKGYSILFSEKEASVITTADSLKKGDRVKILVSDGEAISTINEVNTYDKKRSKL